MWERARELVEAQGSKVLFGTRLESIRLSGGRAVTAVSAASEAGESTATTEWPFDHLISSMPLGELVHAMDPPAPETVREAARGLRYRDFLTVAAGTAGRPGSRTTGSMCTRTRFGVGRVQNFGSWSPELVKDGRTCLGLEYFVFEGDDLWSMGDDDLVALGSRELATLGLVQAGEIEKGYVVRMPKAYPVYDEGYDLRVQAIRDWLALEAPNVHPVGRNGMHRYNNQDHSMMTAMLTVESLYGEQFDTWARERGVGLPRGAGGPARRRAGARWARARRRRNRTIRARSAGSVMSDPAKAEPAASLPAPASVAELAELARGAGLRRVAILAWRDIDDPEAGGSELHAHEVATRWATAGIDVVVRTSSVAGRAVLVEREGYRVVRRSGRYAVFVTGPMELTAGRLGPLDGLVEVWNGMPFLSPLWCRLPRVVFLHHVHGEMWPMTLPSPLAEAGNLLESRLAPPLYRRSRIVTLSESSREEIVRLPGVRADHVSVVPPGIGRCYSPGGSRADRPLVVAVGRLVPVKNFRRLIEILAHVHERIPSLETVIVGEGSERSSLEARLRELGADGYVSLPGRVGPDELVDLYRRAWVVASTSTREGWGLTVSEAAACETTAVATRIPGHVDAIDHGITGMLGDRDEDLEHQLETVLRDPMLRRRLRARGGGARRPPHVGGDGAWDPGGACSRRPPGRRYRRATCTASSVASATTPMNARIPAVSKFCGHDPPAG